jgi:hypothetical protein
MNQETLNALKSAINETLAGMPHAPFLCLPLSAILYALLKDKHGIESSFVTGSLSFKNAIIFKSDFSISGTNNASLQTWAGHAWIELDGFITDLSLFRTIYSDSFTKPCKDELISKFGLGRGAIIASRQAMKDDGLIYEPAEALTDDDATDISAVLKYQTHTTEKEKPWN